MSNELDLTSDFHDKIAYDNLYDVKIEIEDIEFNEAFGGLKLHPTLEDGVYVNIQEEEFINKVDFKINTQYEITKLKPKEISGETYLNSTESTDIQSLGETDDKENQHFVTRHRSKQNKPIGTVYRSYIKKEENGNSNDVSNHELITDVSLKLEEEQDISLYSRDADSLEIYTMERPDRQEYNVRNESTYSVNPEEEVEIDYENSSHRKIIKEIMESKIKNRLKDSDEYLVYGMDRVIESSSVTSSDKFSAHRRYDLSVTVDTSGYIYLSIYPRTKYLSRYKVSESEKDKIFGSGKNLRLNMDYGSRGEVRPVNIDHGGSTTKRYSSLDNRTLVEYHTERYKEGKISEEQLELIKNSDNPPIRAYISGSDDDEPKLFPQELLVVQPNIKNIAEFDEDFKKKADYRTSSDPMDYKEDVRDFIRDYGEYRIYDNKISFEHNFFRGDDRRRIVELFDPEHDIYQFSEGCSHQKSKMTELGAYRSPDDPTIAYVYPEPKEDEYKSFLDKINKVSENMSCEFDFDKISYDYTNTTEVSVNNIIQSLATDYDCVLVVIPRSDGHNSFVNIDKNDFYRKLKTDLGTHGYSSQFVKGQNANPNTESQAKRQYGVIRNICVSLVAKSGGTPFTVEDSMVGDTDMFIGLDVAEHYSQEEGPGGIHMAGVGVAVFDDGTVVGSKSTRSQLGEKIGSSDLQDILRECIQSYEKIKNDKPDKISIHRDGWMNEDISKAKDYMDDIEVDYNIVEVRKTPRERILYNSDSPRDPDQGVALVDNINNTSTIVSWGHPESKNTPGTPRPLTVSLLEGSVDNDIKKISKQVYLLSNSHFGCYNSSLRVPITTEYADRVSGRAAENQTVDSDNVFDEALNFL